MAYVEARQFTSGSDIISAAKGVRDRLFRPMNAKRPEPLPIAARRLDSPKPDIPRVFRRKATSTDFEDAKDYINNRCVEMLLPKEAISGKPRQSVIYDQKMALLVETYLKFDTLTLQKVALLFNVRPTTASKAIKATGNAVREKPVAKAPPDEHRDFIVTGHKGIAMNIKAKTFRSRVSLGGMTITCGTFPTIEQAITARRAKRKSTRLGRYGKTLVAAG